MSATDTGTPRPLDPTTFERHGRLPACRLAQMDLQNLGDLFDRVAIQTNGTGVYKVETAWGTWSSPKLELHRSSYSPGEVIRIEMAVEWHSGNGSLAIDLEGRARRDGAAGYEDTSWLAVEGPEAVVRPLWQEVMEVLNRHSSRWGAIVSSPGAQILGLLVVIAGGIALPFLTLQKAHVDQTISVFITIGVTLVLTLVYVAWVMPTASPRVQIAQWGRLSARRGRVATWAVAIGAGLIAWAVGLLLVFWFTPPPKG